VLALCERVAPEFLARTALYARNNAHLKDLPALLCAVLSSKSPGLLAEIFDRVIDSPKMLRNFVQIIRSGATGRKSLGTLPKRLVQAWLENRSDEQLFVGSVGNDPSLADVIKMVHPKPGTPSRQALFGYLIGRPYDSAVLPERVRAFEAYKAASERTGLTLPDVPFQLLTSMELSAAEWKSIARRAPWQATRMNLNTFLRHGVFEDMEVTALVAERLRSRDQIEKARVLPYQLMIAYLSAAEQMPAVVRDALQDAMDIAVANVPAVNGKVFVFPDISGSMHSPVTGYRRGSSTAVRCVDIAAIVAAAMLRANPTAEVIPFEADIVPPRRVGLNPRDSIMTNAARLAALPCGGTNCSAPLAFLNRRKATGDLVVYVSDNESWIDSPAYGRWGGGATQTLREWARFKKRSPQARMICIDIQPYATAQAPERDDIINVGGFSDQVFNLIAAVAGGGATEGYWVEQIEATPL
jgi:60 kDa SS-A/Ro ribonucleoprotein